MIGTGPFRLKATSTSAAPSSSPHTLLGRASSARQACGSRSTRAAHRWCSRCERARSTSRCSSRRRKASRSRTTRSTRSTTNSVRAHRQVCMRTDIAPFRDARVRRAVALDHQPPAAGRDGSCSARPQVGNDNPFWRGFASTDRTTKQRNAEPPAREGTSAGGRRGESEVHADDVELPRPPRPRCVDPGVRAAGRYRRSGSRSWTCRQVLRLRARRARTTPRPRRGWAGRRR